MSGMIKTMNFFSCPCVGDTTQLPPASPPVDSLSPVVEDSNMEIDDDKSSNDEKSSTITTILPSSEDVEMTTEHVSLPDGFATPEDITANRLLEESCIAPPIMSHNQFPDVVPSRILKGLSLNTIPSGVDAVSPTKMFSGASYDDADKAVKSNAVPSTSKNAAEQIVGGDNVPVIGSVTARNLVALDFIDDLRCDRQSVADLSVHTSDCLPLINSLLTPNDSCASSDVTKLGDGSTSVSTLASDYQDTGSNFGDTASSVGERAAFADSAGPPQNPDDSFFMRSKVSSSNPSKYRRLMCQCGAKNCRKYLY